MATSVEASELYRGNSSPMVPSVSVVSQYRFYGKLASNMRDRKPSEGGNYDLTRAVEEVEGGH